jgi:hypothetical protein
MIIQKNLFYILWKDKRMFDLFLKSRKVTAVIDEHQQGLLGGFW